MVVKVHKVTALRSSHSQSYTTELSTDVTAKQGIQVTRVCYTAFFLIDESGRNIKTMERMIYMTKCEEEMMKAKRYKRQNNKGVECIYI